MSRRRHFSLLIVREDGGRVVRLNVTHRVARGACVFLVVAVSALGALVGDWVQLRELTREAVTFRQTITEQQQLIDSFNRRVGELRQEVAGWRELHARIWEPFGPEMAPSGSAKGIGGGAIPEARGPAGPSPLDELAQLADSVMEQGESLRALDRLISKAGKVLASLPSRWPVRGAVNSEFGRRVSPWTRAIEFHGGMDIGAERGTLVRAPATAVVSFAGPHAEYGLTVILDHGQDIRTVYGHLSKIGVAPGQRIERGTVIGSTGNTGRSSGPHLHYEILVKGQPVNPRAYLWD
ncbi:MAG: peptidoglycan DD-metalloendopeptidase family protein [Candidatus Rokubacteria bacterium]|nr:peptidoglycan DD-metalloendopeptidase family protein [Candidatus Rokubacteria bacterium]